MSSDSPSSAHTDPHDRRKLTTCSATPDRAGRSIPRVCLVSDVMTSPSYWTRPRPHAGRNGASRGNSTRRLRTPLIRIPDHSFQVRSGCWHVPCTPMLCFVKGGRQRTPQQFKPHGNWKRRGSLTMRSRVNAKVTGTEHGNAEILEVRAHRVQEALE